MYFENIISFKFISNSIAYRYWISHFIDSDEYDDDNTAYKVFGGYNFGIVPLIDVAVELSYIDFGSASTSFKNASADVTAVTAAGVLGFNFGPVGLFGKAGVVDWDSDYKISDINVLLSMSIFKNYVYANGLRNDATFA